MKTKKMIHIHAESKVFSCDETVEESKAVSRLIQIRNSFNDYYKNKSQKDDKLKVKTGILNPTLF